MAQFDRSLSVAYFTMIVLTVLANFRVIPVFPHMLMIVLCTIYVGCRMSVRSASVTSATAAAAAAAAVSVDDEVECEENDIVGIVSDEQVVGERMQRRDAMMFPILGSVVLFSLYLIYKFIPKHLINYLLKTYFFLIGTVVVATQLSALLPHYLPQFILTQAQHKSLNVPNPDYYAAKLWDTVSAYLPKSKSTASTAPASTTTSTTPSTEAASSVVGETCSATGCTTSSSSSSQSTTNNSPAPSSSTTILTYIDLLSIILAISLSIWYLLTGHFAASNFFGIAFSIQGIALLSLGSYLNGVILLSGLFFYDIFWVFGTDVMVTVAKSFDAPIKLLFPQFVNPFGEPPATPPQASLLGLGDIVIPGIFIALCLRFDIHQRIQHLKLLKQKQQQQSSSSAAHEHSHHAKPHSVLGHVKQFIRLTPYFSTVFVFYAIGLTTTVLVMYYFHAAQPALLYLVPACLGSSMFVAQQRGELKLLFAFEEAEEEDKKNTATVKKDQ